MVQHPQRTKEEQQAKLSHKIMTLRRTHPHGYVDGMVLFVHFHGIPVRQSAYFCSQDILLQGSGLGSVVCKVPIQFSHGVILHGIQLLIFPQVHRSPRVIEIEQGLL